MSATAILLLRICDDVLKEVRYPGFIFQHGEMGDLVYLRAIRTSDGRHSKIFVVEPKATKFDVLRLAFDAIKATLCSEAAELFTYDGMLAFGKGA